MYNLLIIDMQYEFKTALSVVSEVTELVKKAKEDLAYITVVEYRDSGETFKEITSELTEYPLHRTLIKREDNGSKEVYNYLSSENIREMDIVTCGVNSDCCVRVTVNGLQYMFDEFGIQSKIHVIKNACNHNDHPWKNYIPDWCWDGYNKKINLIEASIPTALELIKVKNNF